MALDAGVIPEALPAGVARADFNAMKAIIDASFPLQTIDLGNLQVTTAKLALLAVTAAQLGPQAVETAKIKLLNITAALLAADAVETDKIKNLNVTIGKAALGFGRFVPRAANAADFAIGTPFVLDGNWYVDQLDTSGIVPAGATAVVFRWQMRATAAGVSGQIRRDVNKSHNAWTLYTQVANIFLGAFIEPIPCDADRLFDCRFFANIDILQVTVVGWFI